jgi:small subunit ribosomal protein S3Ae
MAIGKNKRVWKNKKGGARKIIDPWTKKEWFKVLAPNMFPYRDVGVTMANKTQGNNLVKDNLMGRVFDVSLGDLKPEAEEDSFRKFKLKVEHVDNGRVYTNFHGMDLTTDKLKFLVRRWHTLIEASVDVKTTDGYVLRLFAIGFTKKTKGQVKKTSYAQHSQQKLLRKKMVEIMRKEASTVDMPELVKRLIPEQIGRQIEKASQGIYPLKDVYVRKVKTLRAPKTDVARVMDLHTGAEREVGAKMNRK